MNNEDIAVAIDARVDFDAENIAGVITESGEVATSGRMPDSHKFMIMADMPEYIVYSFDTPIAWYTSERGWAIPITKYSTTSDSHRAIVQDALEDTDADVRTVGFA